MSWAAGLELPWLDSRDTKILELLDEANFLKPIVRFVFPREYAIYRAKLTGMTTDADVTDQQRELFEHLDGLLDYPLEVCGARDPVDPNILDEPNEDLAPYFCVPRADETVTPEEWQVIVHRDERGKSYTHPHVVSIYGYWQVIRLWLALRRCTIRLLIDPRRNPWAEGYGARPNLDRSWTRVGEDGTGYWSSALDSIEVDRWLATAARAGKCLTRSLSRIAEPGPLGWLEGAAMTMEERRKAEVQRISVEMQWLDESWIERRPQFLENLRLLKDLHGEVAERGVPKLEKVAFDILSDALRWAIHLYKYDFDALDAELGTGYTHEATLRELYQPTWTRARRGCLRFLRDYREQFSLQCGAPTIDDGDLEGYLAFAESEGLGAWILDLGALSELRFEDDALLEKRFLHVRSLALMLEPTLKALIAGAEPSSGEERVSFDRPMLQNTLLRFLRIVRMDHAVVGELRSRWETVRRGIELTSMLERIDAPFQNDGCQILRPVLRVAAVRNCTVHSRPKPLPDDRLFLLVQAVTFSPVLCWKLANGRERA